jgi:diguanylate cyclase (GGDEF)-like protein/PAS domain S-box-containing protein
MWVKDADGRYIAANQAYMMVDPSSEGQVIGKTDAEAFPSEKAAAYVADDQIAIRNGVCEHEFSAVNSAGELRYFFTKKSALRDEHGSLVAIVGIARDVTDHRRIEMELASQTRRSRVLSRILEAAATCDTVGPFLSGALAAARELLAYARGGIYMLSEDRQSAHLVSAQGELQDIQAQSMTVPATEEPFAAVYGKGQIYMTTNWHNRGDRSTDERAALTLAVVPLTNQGTTIGSLNVAWHHPFSPDKHLKETLKAIADEIAVGMDRIQAANSYIEAESSLHAFFDSVPEIILVLDPGGRIVVANDYAIRTLGYPADTLTGMNITDLRPAAERQIVLDTIRAMSTGTRASRLETMVTAGGEELAVETTVMRGTWKSSPAIFSVSRDMTAQLHNEQQLREQSLDDPVTGLYNLRGFSAVAGQQLKMAHRAHISAAIVFADVDVRTTPPEVKDRLLRSFAACLTQMFRDSDTVAHVGEERFAVLATQTDNTRLELLTQRLDEAVDQINRERTSDPTLKVKAVAIPAGTPGLTAVDDLLKRADAEMGPENSDPKD